MNHLHSLDQTDPHPNDLPTHAVGGAWAVELWHLDLTWSAEVRALHEVRAGYTPTIWEAIEFVEGQDRSLLLSLFIRCVNQDRPFELEYWFKTATGVRRRARITGFPSKDRYGRLKAIHGIVREVKATAESAVKDSDCRDLVQLMG